MLMYVSSYRKEILIITFAVSFKPCKIILVVRSYFVSQQRVIETGVGGWLYCSTLVLKLPCYSYVSKSSHIKGIYIDRCFPMFLMHLLGITVIANWKFLDIPARNVWIAFCRCKLFALLWRMSLTCRNWFLYARDFRHERVKLLHVVSHLQLLNLFSVSN